MRKAHGYRLPSLIIAALVLVLTACSTTQMELEAVKPGLIASTIQEDEPPIDLEQKSGQITLYSYYDLGQSVKVELEEKLPDIEVKYAVLPADHAVSHYLSAMENGDGDVYILKDSWLSYFNELEVFEDIGQEPYLAEDLLQDFPENLTLSLRSFDEQKLIALPYSADLLVTYYRYDVLSEAGLPADPADLAEHMADHMNWVQLAESLKHTNQWIIPWNSEPLGLVVAGHPIFDRQMEYSLDRNRLIGAIQTGRYIEDLQLASFANIYIDSGKHDIRDGKTVMFYAGTSYVEQLRALASEQAGNWRMSGLPLGLHALNHLDVVAMSASSSNRSASWAVMQVLSESERARVRYLRDMQSDPSGDAGDPFFGGQQIDVFQAELMDQLPERKLTPIDQAANQILWEVWNQYLYESSITAEDLAFRIEEEITQQLAREIRGLSEILREAAE